MKAKLVKKVTEAKGTKSFVFKLEESVDHLPGQFFYFTLPKLNYPDPRGATRHFTISSSITEGELLQLTTRIREESGYKKTLDELKVGDFVEVEGPNGTFILDANDSKPNVLVAGGIGVTPFRSMIKYAVDKNLGTSIFLIYSNSNEEDFAFKKEFENIVKENSNIKVNFVVTSKVGRVDDKMLPKILEGWGLKISDPTFWVVGPPPMVDSMEEILEKLHVSSSQTRTEKFTGY